MDEESRFPLLEKVNLRELDEPDIVLSDAQTSTVTEFLSVTNSHAQLEAEGLKASVSMLLFGPPGCGKSRLARYIARKLGLDLYIARLDGLISSYLGSTSKNIRALFEFASRTPCVLFLDEFDALAKLRGDTQELGELKRVVNSFIQNLDSLGTQSVVLAATNHHELLDVAVWPRRSAIVPPRPAPAGHAPEAVPILVVDDDPETLRHVRDTLADAGYAPLVTGDPGAVARLIRAEKPRLVLLDLMLPGTDGIQLMQTVPELADLPVIFISGYGRDETIARALEAGAEDYVVKPFSPTELTARIRAALRRRSKPVPFALGALAIDYDQRRVTVAGRPVELTATEYELLRVLRTCVTESPLFSTRLSFYSLSYSLAMSLR